MVEAGSGSAGKDGGSVTFYAKKGNITLGKGAKVSAGDGGMGKLKETKIKLVSGGKGGVGGDVVLRSPKGNLTVENSAKIHIGSGGKGADMKLKNVNSLAAKKTVQLENGGGASGTLGLDMASVTGLNVEKTTYEEKSAWQINSIMFQLRAAQAEVEVLR